MTAQDKADILRARWDKAHHFTDGGLNTLGWNNPFPFGGTEEDYVQIVDDHWKTLQRAGWDGGDCAILMLGGERAQMLLRS